MRFNDVLHRHVVDNETSHEMVDSQEENRGSLRGVLGTRCKPLDDPGYIELLDGVVEQTEVSEGKNLLETRVAGTLGSDALASVRSHADSPGVLSAGADLSGIPVTVALDLAPVEVAAEVLGVGRAAIVRGKSVDFDDVGSERARAHTLSLTVGALGQTYRLSHLRRIGFTSVTSS